jgi:REase_DpnII-MboI
MTNIRLPRAICAVVNEVLQGSHAALEELFVSCGAPLPAPGLAHQSKWKEWLYRAGTDPDVDSLALLGGVLEEFMDVAPPNDTRQLGDWATKRERVVAVLEENGFRYYRGGRVLPTGQLPDESPDPWGGYQPSQPSKPNDIDALLTTLIKGLRRAMHPLTHRRKGAQPLTFGNEYDVQDLLHALLRPWVLDIRPEEFTPSYAGSSTRMDFLLPKHKLVIEIKFVRDRQHAKKIGDELIIDIEHYRRHPTCDELLCVIFDPDHLLGNAEGLRTDLEGDRKTKDGSIKVKLFVL